MVARLLARLRSPQAAPVLAELRPEPLDITALYKRYGDLVLNRCRMLLRNEADAQDTCQEVFLKLHRYQDSFRGESSPSTWIFKITTTTCLNQIRSRRRRPEDPVEELPSLSYDSLLDRVEVHQLLQLVLQEADERTQLCIVHHYADGMTHDEIGEALGISGAAVRKRIALFRQGLQERSPAWLREVAP